MLIVTIRTDKPEAEIGLFNDSQKLQYETWQAHRELAETIHLKLEALLQEAGKTLNDIEGFVVFKGPGSFTGLRIGVAVANALADSLTAPVVATDGNAWIEDGISRLLKGENGQLALPDYGRLPNITPQKK